MHIIIDNVEQFKNFFEVIYDSSSEVLELRLFPDRMVCSVLDRSRTRYFNATFEDEFFDEYVIDDIESVTVSVDDLNILLKSCTKTDTIILEINDPYMVAKVMSENGNSRVFEFVLPIDEVTSPPTPHLELPAVFKCDVRQIKQAVDDIQRIISNLGQDLFRFNIVDNELFVTTSDEVSTKYSNNLAVETISESENVSSMFTLEYIKQITRFYKISYDVTFKIGQDMPVFYTIEDSLMGVTVSGMIAPRLKEED